MKSFQEMQPDAEEAYREYLERKRLQNERVENFQHYLAGYLWGKLDIPEEDKGYATLDVHHTGTAILKLNYPGCAEIQMKITVYVKTASKMVDRIAYKRDLEHLAWDMDLEVSRIPQDRWRIPASNVSRTSLAEAVTAAYKLEQERLSKSRQNSQMQL